MKLNLLTTALLMGSMAFAQNRQEVMLSDNWEFSQDGQHWQVVSIPHDWAIAGPFDKKWDLQVVAIEQNGEKEPTEKSGRSGSLPWIGEGVYKRTLMVPDGFSGHAELLFDGAMAEPTVYVNGVKAGYWAYGYNAFRVDITEMIDPGVNALEVHLKNLEESSRWYPGAGLYRPVTLILTPQQARIDDWGIRTETTKIHEGKNDGAMMKVEVAVADYQTGMTVGLALLDADGKVVAECSPEDTPTSNGKASTVFGIAQAKLWTPETPYLYNLSATLWHNGEAIDQKTIKVGLRTVSVSAKGGFQLNGVTRKLKGVCLHHDLGPLGAAINKAALVRQIKILKDMGCDAIRTAHNMPSQMQMDICDSLGMMVMAESFDMWLYPKCKNGYARFFREWADKDITNLVKANRNHPSIVMWSIGNEIPEQWSKEGTEIAAHLQNLCHRLDPTRPVTQGMDKAEQALSSGFAQVMDVPGFNYRVHKYNNNIKLLPQGFLLGSETASTVSSRGVYKFPVVPDDNSRFASYAKNYDPNAIKQADGQCSGYDVEYCPWSNLPDDDWVWQDDCDWVIGEFVWTGFDYLGEPSPYDEYWPSRSSYFGICDLAGLPKDRYWLYRSHWNRQDHTIHLLPHWTWGKEREGQVTPVYCYTDHPEAELFVNGKSQGRIKKLKNLKIKELDELKILNIKELNDSNRLDRYRLRWNDVVYEPGELKVVVYDENGQQAGEKVVKTASRPAKLQLDVWTQQSNQSPLPWEGDGGRLLADGQDLAFITVSLTDKQGTLIPDAADKLRFEVSGAGTFRAVCNGDATSLESFAQPTMQLFHGQLVVVVQAGKKPGNITLKVTDPERGLTSKITIPVADGLKRYGGMQ